MSAYPASTYKEREEAKKAEDRARLEAALQDPRVDVASKQLMDKFGWDEDTSRTVAASYALGFDAISGYAYVRALQGLEPKVLSGAKSITLEGNYFVADNMKTTSKYYERLHIQGRPAPFLQAREVLSSYNSKISDPQGRAGFFLYKTSKVEMVFNPKTGEIWHIQPIKQRRVK